MLLGVRLEQPFRNFGMVKDNLLLPHVLNCVVGVNLNWVVVLVDLDAKSSTGGEVVWLRKMTKAVVLHGLAEEDDQGRGAAWPQECSRIPSWCEPCPLSPSQAAVLHGLKNVVVSHPGASLARSLLPRLRPDLVKAWHDERSPLHLKGELQLAVEDGRGDIRLRHLEHLLSIDCPDIVHLFQTSTVRG